MSRFAVLVFFSILATACGNKGALYLPESAPEVTLNEVQATQLEQPVN